jgi:hypothetical protein
MLPADEFEFTGQLVQFALPEEFLYVPDGQIVHCPFKSPLSGPVYPGLHRQTFTGAHTPLDHPHCAKSFPESIYDWMASCAIYISLSVSHESHIIRCAKCHGLLNTSPASGSVGSVLT